MAIAPAAEIHEAYIVDCCGAQGKAAPVYNDNVLDDAEAPRRSKSGGKRTFSDAIGTTCSSCITSGVGVLSERAASKSVPGCVSKQSRASACIC